MINKFIECEVGSFSGELNRHLLVPLGFSDFVVEGVLREFFGVGLSGEGY